MPISLKRIYFRINMTLTFYVLHENLFRSLEVYQQFFKLYKNMAINKLNTNINDVIEGLQS